MSFMCDHCGISCSRLFNLQRHYKNFHNITLQNNKIRKIVKRDSDSDNCKPPSECYSCPIQGCDFVSHKIKRLDSHFTNNHPELEINKNEFTFQNAEEFKTWKSTLEKQNKCSFISHSGRKSKYEYYYCHRSGQFRTSSTGKRHLKTQGSCKLGSYCPAKIRARISDCGKFNVTYVSTHVGHSHDLAHLRISPNIKKQLAEKMLNKIPDNIIIEEVRKSITDDVQRVHLLSKRDLYNIRREFKIPHDLRRDENDAVDVNLKVQQLRKAAEAEDQNEDVSCSPFYEPEDFVMEEIINEVQIKDTRDEAVQQSKLLSLFEDIVELIKTPEDDVYFYNELVKLKNHFLSKNSAVQMPILMPESNEEKNTRKRRSCSTKKKSPSKTKKIIEKPTLAGKSGVTSVNFSFHPKHLGSLET